MHPTAAKSPALKPATSPPVRTTRPTISWPGTMGYSVVPHSLWAWCRSEWQTPQYRISIWTSCGPGSRRSNVKGTSSVVALWPAYPAVVVPRAFLRGLAACALCVTEGVMVRFSTIIEVFALGARLSIIYSTRSG